MKIRTGDNVVVTKGKYRGKTGKVVAVYPNLSKILIEGVNIVKRHIKPRRQGDKGQIINAARPIAIASVKLVCPDTKKGTRVGYAVIDGSKKRVSRKSGKVIS